MQLSELTTLAALHFAEINKYVLPIVDMYSYIMVTTANN